MSPIVQLHPSVSEQLKDLTQAMKQPQRTMELLVADRAAERAQSSGQTSSVSSTAVQATTVAGAFLGVMDKESEVLRRRRTESPLPAATQRIEQVRQQPLAAAQALVATLEERVPPEQRGTKDAVDETVRAGNLDRATLEHNRALAAEGLLSPIFGRSRLSFARKCSPVSSARLPSEWKRLRLLIRQPRFLEWSVFLCLPLLKVKMWWLRLPNLRPMRTRPLLAMPLLQ
jgi:hypothetical protein